MRAQHSLKSENFFIEKLNFFDFSHFVEKKINTEDGKKFKITT